MSLPEFAYIPGFPGYAISRGGRVYSCLPRGPERPKWRPRRPFIGTTHRGGRPGWCVRLYVNIDGEMRARIWSVGRLMALAWLPPRPRNHVLGFRDGDKTNIHADNLFWESMSARLIAKPTNAKVTPEMVTEMRREVYRQAAAGQYPDFEALGERFGCCGQNVKMIAMRKSWGHVADGIPAWKPGPRVVRRGAPKLAEADVRRIKRRLARGERPRDIHRDYAHVVKCPETIVFIARGINWKHVKV